MEHDLELFSPILEILKIGVCNIIYNPGNIGKRIYLIFQILEILENDVFLVSTMLEIYGKLIFHISSYP